MCKYGFIKGMAVGMAAGMVAGAVLAPTKKRPSRAMKCAGEMLDSLAELIGR